MERFDLPDADITLHRGVFGPDVAARLFVALQSEIAWRQDEIEIHGKAIPIPRLQAWIGEPEAIYTYSHLRLVPIPWTSAISEIKAALENLRPGAAFNGVLCSLYRHGRDSIGWHADREPELGPEPVIASVSFGASRTIGFQHRRRKDIGPISIPLHSGDVLWMAGPTQARWRHRIAKRARAEDVGVRVNLSFRRIVPLR